MADGMAGIAGMVKAKNMFAGLLKKNKDANEESTKNMMNHSAKKDAFLIDACQQGSLNLVQKFITKDFCSPNLLSPDGKSLVQLALEGGHDAVVMYLLLEQHAAVVDARGVKGLPKDEKADSLHISLIKMCVMKTTDREKAFAVAMEALAHSTNQTLSALLLAEMYKEVARLQPSHRHTLTGNATVLENVAFTLLDQAAEEDVMQILAGLDPNYGNNSPLQVAIRSHNSHFVSHPHVQELVSKVWIGIDPLRQNFDGSSDTKANIGWDFVLKPKQFFGSPRGHFLLHIYTYLIFIVIHWTTSMELRMDFSTPPTGMEYIFTVLAICGGINEIEKCWRQGKSNYLNFFWNYADVLLFILLAAFIIMRNVSDLRTETTMIRQILALSAVPLYIRLLELLVLSRRFGPLMLIIQNVISEVLYFMILVLLMIVAFGQCTSVLFTDPNMKELEWFKTFGSACETLFIAMLGVLDESQVTEVREEYEIIGPLIIFFYLIITSIILLNLLIAILSNIYKKIDEKSNEEWMFLWASTVMRLQQEVEETLPPPLNVVLRIFKVFPKKIHKKLIFTILLIIEYVPGVLFAVILYMPYKVIQIFARLLNPMTWKSKNGNPFVSAAVSSDDMMAMQGMDPSYGQQNSLKKKFTKYWEDNFTNADEVMMGRDNISFQYNSAERRTILDKKSAGAAEQAANIAQMRDELRDVFSMSNGDSVSMVSELLSTQDHQTKMFESFSINQRELENRIKHLNASLAIAQRSINVILDTVKSNQSSSGSSDARTDSGDIRDILEEADDIMSLGTTSIDKASAARRKTKFLRPRMSAVLKKN